MTACSSGATAVGLGRDLIRSGAARAMIVGGTEPLCRMTFASFNALKAVDPGVLPALFRKPRRSHPRARRRGS